VSFINLYAFFEDPEKEWRKKIAEEKQQEKCRQSDTQQYLFHCKGLPIEKYRKKM
jgi:hypothetical protein